MPSALRGDLPFVRPRPCPGVRSEWRRALEGTALLGLEGRWRAQELSGGRRGRYDSRRGTIRWGSREFPAAPFAEWSEDDRWRWLEFRPEVAELRARGARRWRLELFERDEFDVTDREAEILALIVAGTSGALAWTTQELGPRRTFFLVDVDERRASTDELLVLHLGICVDDLGLDPVACLAGAREVGVPDTGVLDGRSPATESSTGPNASRLGVDQRGDPEHGQAIWIESRWFEVAPPKSWSSFPVEVRSSFEPLIAASFDGRDPVEFVQRFHRTWSAWESRCAQLEVLRGTERDRDARWFEQQLHWLREASRELLIARWLAPGVAVHGQTSYHLVPRPVGELEILQVTDHLDAGAGDAPDETTPVDRDPARATAHRAEGADDRAASDGDITDGAAPNADTPRGDLARTNPSPESSKRRGRWRIEARSAWGRIRYSVGEFADGLRIVGREDRAPEDDDWVPYRF